MSSQRSLLSAVVVLLFAVACGKPDAPPPGEEVASTVKRDLTSAPAGDVQRATSNNGDFAFDLYRKLKTGDDNLFFSPHSISLALSMAYGGANGSTTTAFESTLHQSLAEPAYHRAMNDLDRQLAARGKNAKAGDGSPFKLNIVNQFFAQKGFAFETPYLDLLAKEYGAGVRLMDFKGAANASRVEINDWVADRTADRIKDLLDEGAVNGDTRAVIVNAIYFNAAWKKKFDRAGTKDAAFTKLDGSTVQVPTMHVSDLDARGAVVDGIEVLEVPYDGDELSALIIMPKAGDLPALESKLTSAELARLTAPLANEKVTLALPKFELRTTANLNDPLKDLGLGVMFSSEADFTRMSKEEALQVTDVIHQAFVKVDESGTEAAAATAISIGVTSLPQTRDVKIDRPFVLLIKDDATGAVLFAGRVTNPK